MKKYLACLVFLWSTVFVGAQITYVDATPENTFLADGTALSSASYTAVAAASANNAKWNFRRNSGDSNLANAGNVFVSGDAGSANSAPTLVTKITGLTPGKQYNVYAYFWDTGAKAGWNVKAGFSAANLATYKASSAAEVVTKLGSADSKTSSAAAPVSSTQNGAFSGKVMIQSGNRNLYEIKLGTFAADQTGEISVYIDDSNPTNNANRTWYDGLGYAPVTPEVSTTATATTLRTESDEGNYVTYIDASLTNTFLADGTALSSNSYTAVTGAAANGAKWNFRRNSSDNNLANAGNIFASGDSGSSNSAPTVMTKITGLTPEKEYEVYVYFWDTSSLAGWNVKAGFSATNLKTYAAGSPSDAVTKFGSATSSSTAVVSSSENGYFSENVMIQSGNRDLYEAYLGIVSANAAGEISVYIDDSNPTSTSNRTWYDGVGYAPAGFRPIPPVPEPEHPNAITLADDAAWTWYNDPRAIFHNGTLYTGYVRMSDGASCVNACDTITGDYNTILVSTIKQKDDHNNPGLLALSDGRLMAFLSRHGGLAYSEYYISTSTTPMTASDWSATKTITGLVSASYQNPYQLTGENGRIYNFMRSTAWNPCVSISDDLGTTWNTSKHFIATGDASIRPYVKYTSNYKDRIDFLYTDGHPRDEKNSLYHLYMKGGKLYKTDGTTLKTAANATVERTMSNLPILHNSGERGSVIYQYSEAETTNYDEHIPSGRSWCHEIVYDKKGDPVCVFTVRTGPGDKRDTWVNNRIFYYYAKFDSSTGEWKKRFIAKAGRALYRDEGDYAGGIAIDPENPNVIYISTNAATPFELTDITDTALNTNERYEIYRGVITDENTLAIEWTPVTQNSSADNLRPYVPRNSPYRQSLIYFHGTYSSYTSWNAKARGIFLGKKENYADWATANGLTGAAAAGNADPNNDGIDNLTAYAFGLPAQGALSETDLAKLPKINRQSDGKLNFSFTINTLLADITYETETSADLKNWSPVTAEFIGESDDTQTYAVPIEEDEPRRFYRVKVTQ